MITLSATMNHDDHTVVHSQWCTPKDTTQYQTRIRLSNPLLSTVLLHGPCQCVKLTHCQLLVRCNTLLVRQCMHTHVCCSAMSYWGTEVCFKRTPCAYIVLSQGFRLPGFAGFLGYQRKVLQSLFVTFSSSVLFSERLWSQRSNIYFTAAPTEHVCSSQHVQQQPVRLAHA